MANTPYYTKAETDALDKEIKKQFTSGVIGTVTPNVGGIPQINGSDITENGFYFIGQDGDYGTVTGVSVSDQIPILEVTNIETTAVYSVNEYPITLTIDETPTEGSTNAVESGGVFNELSLKADKEKTVESLEEVTNVSDFTENGLTINSLTDGALNVTLNRTYPWATLDTDIYQFILDAQSKYVVVAKDSNSVLTVTTDPSINSCRIFRFTDTDGLSAVVTNLPNNEVDYGSVITCYRIGTVITMYDDGVLFFTYDYSGSSEPEFLDTLCFGNVFTSGGTQLTGIKKVFRTVVNIIDDFEDRITVLETGENIIPDTTELQGEDIADVGDSILDQNGMQPILKTRFENATNQSLAVSGKRFTGDDSSAITEQVQDITGTPALILMGGGTNDFGNNVALGNIGSSDNDEFYGAINFCANYLVTNFSTSKILWLGLPFGDWQTAGSFATGQTNSLGLSRYDYDEACRKVARNYGITYVSQLEELGWNLTNINDKTTDRIHPNAEGSQDRADLVSIYINKIFN